MVSQNTWGHSKNITREGKKPRYKNKNLNLHSKRLEHLFVFLGVCYDDLTSIVRILFDTDFWEVSNVIRIIIILNREDIFSHIAKLRSYNLGTLYKSTVVIKSDSAQQC